MENLRLKLTRVHVGIKWWNLAYTLLDVRQINCEHDIEYLYCTNLNMQISIIMLIRQLKSDQFQPYVVPIL